MLLTASTGESPIISNAAMRSRFFARESYDSERTLDNSDMLAITFAKIPAGSAIPVTIVDPTLDTFDKKLVFIMLPPKDAAARRSCDEDADDPRTDWILALLTSFSNGFEIF